MANITTIFKKGKKLEVANYRLLFWRMCVQLFIGKNLVTKEGNTADILIFQRRSIKLNGDLFKWKKIMGCIG